MSKIVQKSSNASCRLDPIPTWLLKSCLDVLACLYISLIVLLIVLALYKILIIIIIIIFAITTWISINEIYNIFEGSKTQYEFTEKLRKYDLLFLRQSAWPYAACLAIYFSQRTHNT